MAYVQDFEAREFYAGEAAGDLALATCMGLTADAVQSLAPAPDPLPTPDDYSGRAKRAELFLGRYLWRTQGFVSSQGITALSVSFDVQGTAIRQIVAESMGEYFTGGTHSVAYVGRMPE